MRNRRPRRLLNTRTYLTPVQSHSVQFEDISKPEPDDSSPSADVDDIDFDIEYEYEPEPDEVIPPFRTYNPDCTLLYRFGPIQDHGQSATYLVVEAGRRVV